MADKTECQFCKYGEWRDGYMFCKMDNRFVDPWGFCWDFLDEDL